MIGDERRVEILLGTKEPMEDAEADEFKPLETSRDEEEDEEAEEALKDGDGRSREESGWWNI